MNQDRENICVIGDRETISGFLLCGLGSFKEKENNFFFTDGVKDDLIKEAFNNFMNRKETLIIFITQEVSKKIKRATVTKQDPVPSVVVIPGNEDDFKI